MFYMQRGYVGCEDNDQKLTRKSSEAGGGTGYMSTAFHRKLGVEVDECLFITEDLPEFKHGMKNFALNTRHIYFWNDFNIWCYALDTPVVEFQTLGLIVDPNEKQSRIKRVRTGSNDTKIGVLVKQSKTADAVIVWNVEGDNEIESFDTNPYPRMFFDEQGDI